MDNIFKLQQNNLKNNYHTVIYKLNKYLISSKFELKMSYFYITV